MGLAQKIEIFSAGPFPQIILLSSLKRTSRRALYCGENCSLTLCFSGCVMQNKGDVPQPKARSFLFSNWGQIYIKMILDAKAKYIGNTRTG